MILNRNGNGRLEIRDTHRYHCYLERYLDLLRSTSGNLEYKRIMIEYLVEELISYHQNNNHNIILIVIVIT